MKQLLAPVILGFALTGCVSSGMWSEAPRDDYYGDGGYADRGAPVDWWGSNAVSVDVFYGALAGYGRWDMHPGYGRVFIPAGVGPGWQPYSRGYWVNDPRYGRRWVSSEPFGWATYHYGRWGRDSRMGWFWVPDTRFGPSWVDWRSHGGYDSWAPLPPFGWDRYARRGYGRSNDWGNDWGNDWWLHAPSRYAWRPGMQQHVRRGRPGSGDDRPGTDQPRAYEPRPQESRPGMERPPRDDVVDGRHPRSDRRYRDDRTRDGAQRDERQRDGSQREGRSQPGFERADRQQRGAPDALRERPGQQERAGNPAEATSARSARVDGSRATSVRASAPVSASVSPPERAVRERPAAPRAERGASPREAGRQAEERSD